MTLLIIQMLKSLQKSDVLTLILEHVRGVGLSGRVLFLEGGHCDDFIYWAKLCKTLNISCKTLKINQL